MNILKAIFNIPLRIFQLIAFGLSIIVFSIIIHYALAIPLHIGSWLIVQNAMIARRLMAFSFGMSFRDFDAEIMGMLRDRNQRK